MTWGWPAYGGGETRDLLIEGVSPSAYPWNYAGLMGDMSIITTPVKTGVAALQIGSGSTTAMAIVLNFFGNTKLYCLQTQINCDGNPTAAFGLFAPFETTLTAAYALEVGTDRRVRIVALGTNGSWANRIPLTPWSVGTVGNGAYAHLVMFLDPLTLGTNHVVGTVLIDSVTQIVADLGVWPASMGGEGHDQYTVGCYGVAPGVNVRLDDICAGQSTVASDAPHLVAVPIGKVCAQHPATDTGATLNWTRTPASGTWFSKWADATGNDGNTTILSSVAISEYEQTSGMESLATLGWAAGAVVLENGTGIGPVWSAVMYGTAGKWDADAICNLAPDVGLSHPGTTYVGVLKRLTRTGGGSWSRTDVGNIFTGAQVGPDGVVGIWITSLMLQWLYSEANLPLTPAPMIPQSCIF